VIYTTRNGTERITSDARLSSYPSSHGKRETYQKHTHLRADMHAAMVIGATVTCHVQKRGEKQEHLGLELGHTCSTRTCTAARVRFRRSRGGVRDSGANRGGDGTRCQCQAGIEPNRGPEHTGCLARATRVWSRVTRNLYCAVH
jgi:hypothetical protein